MHTVMLADDEETIRRGLRGMIARRLPGLQVIAEAEDGEIALQNAIRFRPDILLIDINMPFLSGLELIAKLNSVHRDCIIIVVSGFDEFDYARRALALHVFEYILKPVDQDELCAVLERAVLQLRDRREQNQYLVFAREQLERNRDLLIERFMREWLSNRLEDSELKAQIEGFSLDFSRVAAMVVVRSEERLNKQDKRNESERRVLLYALRHLAEKCLESFGVLISFVDDAEEVVLVCSNQGGAAWVDALSKLEQICESQLRQIVLIVQTELSPIAPGELPALADAWDLLREELSQRSGNAALVLNARSFIERNFGKPDLSLELVAAKLEVSTSYLSRLLKQETGMSFVDYMTGYRIHQAMLLLQDPVVKVAEVAQRCGYRSQQYFSRAFRRIMACSPIDYRKHGRGNPEQPI